MNQIPGVAILGCGLIGQKRSKVLRGAKLVVCADIDEKRAQALAAEFPNCDATTNWLSAVQRADVDIVIVATTNDALVKTSLAAVNAGKHVLVEKPAARNVAELDPLIEASRKNNVQVRVGFNHRYHPALLKARELELDLVEIAPMAKPPVAKIIDFNKFLYQEEKKKRVSWLMQANWAN